MKYILAIDLGGTKIAVGIVNFQGKVLSKLIEPTQIKLGPRGVIRQMIRMGKQVQTNADRTQTNTEGQCGSVSSQCKSVLMGVGIGAAGPMNTEKGIILSPPNLPGWKNVQLVAPIKKAFKKPVFLDNDANAAALGEWMFGAGKGTANMVYFTISTGIGSGIIINKELYRGQGNAGELGHMIINPNGPKCGCGNYGCLEAFSSGTSIAREAKKIGLKMTDAKSVFRAAVKGNKKAQKIIFNALSALSIGLVNTIHIFHPDKIILGGGVMKNKKYILPFLRQFVRDKVMPGFKNNIKIEAAKLGPDVGLIGAACVVIKKFNK